MKFAIALAAAGMMTLSLPALAQNAAPGAGGTGTGMSGGPAQASPAPSNTMGGTSGGGMNEGRATSPDMTNTPGDKANNAPSTVRGDQDGQGAAKP